MPLKSFPIACFSLFVLGSAFLALFLFAGTAQAAPFSCEERQYANLADCNIDAGRTGSSVSVSPTDISGACAWDGSVPAWLRTVCFDAPRLTTPTSWAVNVSVNPTFQWTDTSATRYKLQVIKTPTGVTVIDAMTWLTDYTVPAVQTLESNTTYLWRVGSCADTSCAQPAWSPDGQWPFTTTAALNPPTNLNPASGSTMPSSNVTLSWTAPASGPAPAAYKLEVKERVTGNPGPLDGFVTQLLSVADAFTPNITYSWRVGSCDAPGCGGTVVWSHPDPGMGTWPNFIVVPGNPPSVDSISHSPDPADTADAIDFTIVASDNNGVSSIRADIENSGGGLVGSIVCNYPVPSTPVTCAATRGPFPADNYVVLATATDNDGLASPTRSYNFPISAVGATPPPTSPNPADGGTIATLNYTLQWTNSDPLAIHHFDIEVIQDGVGLIAGASPVPPPGTSYNVAGLIDGASYTWRVRSCNDAACSSPSLWTSWHFRVNTGGGPPPPPGPVPVGPFAFPNPLGATSFTDLVKNIIDFLFTLAVIVAPVLLVIAGVIFMTAAGDPSRVGSARRMLLWTVIGFGIILMSKGLVEVLRAILGI